MKNYNLKTVSLKLTRRELCDLELACTVAYFDSGNEYFVKLHDKIANIIADFDEKHMDELKQYLYTENVITEEY